MGKDHRTQNPREPLRSSSPIPSAQGTKLYTIPVKMDVWSLLEKLLVIAPPPQLQVERVVPAGTILGVIPKSSI